MDGVIGFRKHGMFVTDYYKPAFLEKRRKRRKIFQGVEGDAIKIFLFFCVKYFTVLPPPPPLTFHTHGDLAAPKAEKAL